MELVQRVESNTRDHDGNGLVGTPVPGLWLLRSNHPKPPGHLIFRPSLCIVVQGAKWAVFGGRHLDYGAGQALVISVESPALGRVVQASPEKPYLGIVIEFDLPIMREVAETLGASPSLQASGDSGVFVTNFDGPLADCTLRLMRLIDTPAAIPLLHPTVMREVAYWLLSGPHAAEIARMVLTEHHAHRVIGAIHHLRDHFDQPMRVDDLAARAKMSASAFHRRFRSITSMTPLQYQKQMRLLEARRMMVADGVNAASAGSAVGYESASQFSREYSRMFGAPPHRDTRQQKA